MPHAGIIFCACLMCKRRHAGTACNLITGGHATESLCLREYEERLGEHIGSLEGSSGEKVPSLSQSETTTGSINTLLISQQAVADCCTTSADLRLQTLTDF